MVFIFSLYQSSNYILQGKGFRPPLFNSYVHFCWTTTKLLAPTLQVHRIPWWFSDMVCWPDVMALMLNDVLKRRSMIEPTKTWLSNITWWRKDDIHKFLRNMIWLLLIIPIRLLSPALWAIYDMMTIHDYNGCLEMSGELAQETCYAL